MSDNHSKEQRSYNMSRIRGRDTKPEEAVRKYLFSKGFRYRKNVHSLPGCPDIVLPKHKTVIFVHGCFWHMHNCDKFHWPKSNIEYWQPKIMNNAKRDMINQQLLRDKGWNVALVWECALKTDLEGTMNQIINEYLS